MLRPPSLLTHARVGVPRCAVQAARRWQTTEATTQATAFASRLGNSTPVEAVRGPENAAPGSEEPHQGTQAPAQRKKTDLDVAEEFLEYQRQKALFKDIGGSKTPTYAPHQLISNPPRPSDITLELLLASQSHMGHITSRWNPANAAYIFGVRDNTHIISLEVTAAHLRRAAKVVSAVSARGGLILFVGTREGQERIVVRAAELAGGYHLFDRWVPGSLTNSTQILGQCRLKVVNEFDEEVPGYESQLDGMAPLKPDLVVCLNPLENQTLLRECAHHNVPTIGIIDTDANPLLVTYPIPANDDSLRCTAVIAGVLGRAGEEGRNYRLEQAKQGRITTRSTRSLTPKRSHRR
ncbi:ribosomal protein S2 [Verruconis gallopava]|uniref:Ribosomal protein S2 n=1 Tax=Verruconis gallopava TaxID=253628 RepID=A0A0D2A277_9PEZI|nr:ribosomal protein S2 [Verruconis gallopava]KIW00868.1 ribosomal protein S2 [Verruconis gallopava]